MANEEIQDVVEDEDEIQVKKYLMCRIGEEVYGIDIAFVTDIIELQTITAVPDLPKYVKGVINLRGQVIPIIDLRLRFKMAARDYDDRTVITVVRIHNSLIGFIIDTATEVQEIPVENIDPAPAFQGKEGQKRYIAGLGKIDGQVIIILDVENIVAQQEVELINSESYT